MRWLSRCLIRSLPSLFILGLGYVFLSLATDGFQAFTTETARRLEVERRDVRIESFTLTDFAGRVLSVPNDKVALVEFIYTTCPTICQTAGDDFFLLHEKLRREGLSAQVQMISVSFDLQNDTLENLAVYANLHGAEGGVWTVAKPYAHELGALLRNFGVTVIPDEYGGYQHNAAIHVVDRHGRLRAILDSDDVTGVSTKVASFLDDRVLE